jgi:hypothetical protein
MFINDHPLLNGNDVWEETSVRSIQQNNTFDFGIFAIENGLALMNGEDLVESRRHHNGRCGHQHHHQRQYCRCRHHCSPACNWVPQTEAPVASRRLACERCVRRLAKTPSEEPECIERLGSQEM